MELNVSDILFRPAASPSDPASRYPGYEPGTTVLKAGTVMKPGAAPIACDLVLERDVAVTMRDGVRILVDVYRPADATGQTPAIIAWSAYGKRDGYLTFDDFPHRAGVPQRLLSGLDKFEGPDPNWWCPRGYAVVNPDARGAYRSKGRLMIWDAQEGRDGADLVEWVAAQDWCTGKVGLAGTSWLTTTQWLIAGERPPHLAAIAPWEGFADCYRNVVGAGGVLDAGFVGWLVGKAAGENGIEDLAAMLERHPRFDEYWERKRAKVEAIDVPAYVVASWGNVLHCMGTFEAWRRLRTPDRWLRVSNSLEWPDFYDNVYQEDLRRFFDRFLREIDNGWEATPPVRLTVFDAAANDLVDRAETAFPPERARDRAFHLDSSCGVMSTATAEPATIAYDAATGAVTFELSFNEEVEINGFPQLRLALEADGADDADVFVKLVKLSPEGEPLGRVLIPRATPENAAAWDGIVEVATGQLRTLYYYDGPWGRMRASRRGDADVREAPWYDIDRPLAPGEVALLPITLTPVAMLVHRGERLRLTVSGVNLTPYGAPGATPPVLRNRGRHVVHTGGAAGSVLVLPIA